MYFAQAPIDNPEAELLAKRFELVDTLFFRSQPALEQKKYLRSDLRTEVQGI